MTNVRRLAALLIASSLAGVALADDPPSPTTPPAAGRRTVEVLATGSAKFPADRFAVYFTLTTGSVRSGDADATAERLLDRVREIVSRAGGDASALQPATRPTTEPVPATSPADAGRIALQRSVNLPARSLEEARTLAAALKPLEISFSDFSAKKPGLYTLGARSSSSRADADPDAVLELATRDAIANARRGATAIARGADAKLGPLIAIGQLKSLSLDVITSETKGLFVTGAFIFEMTD